MSVEPTSTEERNDRKRRAELQEKLQNAVRRSASASELLGIEKEIRELNVRIEAYAHRSRKD